MSARPPLVVAALCVAAIVAGCGPGGGSGTSDVRLTVTRDFGSRSLLEQTRPEIQGEDTVMRLLQRNAPVKTRFGGGFVQAIGDVAGGLRGGRPYDWFFYVNGSLAEEGSTSVDLHAGDRVWWDHRDWGITAAARAVVGSFPEPFVHGIDGRRLPVRVECADADGPVCDAVGQTFVDLGLPAGRSGLSRSAADDSLRVLVGPWSVLRGREIETDLVDDGPQRSGVYARFDRSGKRLTVLDERGRAARTLASGAGLVAAVRSEDRRPVWLVTGTDATGVAAAAAALDEATLSDRFALAIAGGRPVDVPLLQGARR